MTREALTRGPRDDRPPAPDGAWRALQVRPFGTAPGILIADARNELYLLLFDPPENPEMRSGAQVVSSRLLHAVGYHVPETYLVTFERAKLVVGEGAEIVSSADNTRELTARDVDVFLQGVARPPLGRYRAAALHAPAEWVGLLGPYQLYTTRSDDPNDIVPHEHRRELRGFFVVSAWINHVHMRALATLDVLVEDGGVPHIHHLLADLVATLGSGYSEAKRAHEGNDPLYDGAAALKNIFGLGLWTPSWMQATFG